MVYFKNVEGFKVIFGVRFLLSTVRFRFCIDSSIILLVDGRDILDGDKEERRYY